MKRSSEAEKSKRRLRPRLHGIGEDVR